MPGTDAFEAPAEGSRVTTQSLRVWVAGQGLGPVPASAGRGGVMISLRRLAPQKTPPAFSGWSIRNKFYWNNAGTWQEKGGGNESFQITVNGYETPANTDATGQPVILASVDEAGILYAHTLDMRDIDGLPFTGETTGHIVFDQYTYQ